MKAFFVPRRNLPLYRKCSRIPVSALRYSDNLPLSDSSIIRLKLSMPLLHRSPVRRKNFSSKFSCGRKYWLDFGEPFVQVVVAVAVDSDEGGKCVRPGILDSVALKGGVELLVASDVLGDYD